MYYIGIDPSILETGIVVLSPDLNVLLATCTKVPPKNDNFTYRCSRMVGNIIHLLPTDLTNKNSFTVIELPIFRHNIKSVMIQTLTGLSIRNELNSFIVNVDNRQIKAFAGNGKADKEELAKLVIEKWSYVSQNHNILDAYIMARLAHAIHTKTLDKKLYKSIINTHNNSLYTPMEMMIEQEKKCRHKSR